MKIETVRPLVATALATALLAACGSAPKPVPALEEAKGAYARAAADESVARHAPEALDEANRALKAAESRWRDKEHVSGVEHYSYLASQRVEIARLIAETKENNRKLENAKLERQRVQLELRSGEAEKARLAAEKAKSEAELARQEALALKRQMEALEAMQAKETERGMVLTLGDVLFDTEESSLRPEAMRNIERIAQFMGSYPEQSIMVEGHTDSMGEEDYNMGLSRDRAFAVRQALVARGVASHRITTQGFGEAQPVASNATSAGRQENRRVEVVFPNAK